MAYTKQNYVNNQIATLANFQAMDNGIAANDAAIASLVHQRSIANLLDNSDFQNPVNQRGNGAVTTGGEFPIDRWFFNKSSAGASSVAAYDAVNRYLVLKCANATWAALYHKLDAALFKPATVYTLALHEKLMEQVNIAIFANNGAVTLVPSTTVRHDNGLVLKSFFIPPNGIANNLLITIYAMSGATVAFDWAALYEGSYTASTLPDYQRKGYAVELAECRRHFIRMKNAVIPCAETEAGTSITGFLPLPMRDDASPAVIISGASACLGSGVHHDIVSANATIDQGVQLVFHTTQSVAAHQCGTVIAAQLDINTEVL